MQKQQIILLFKLRSTTVTVATQHSLKSQLLAMQKTPTVCKPPLPLKQQKKKYQPASPNSFMQFWCKGLLSQIVSQNNFVGEFRFCKQWATCLMLLNHCLFQNWGTRVSEKKRAFKRLLHNCKLEQLTRLVSASYKSVELTRSFWT